MVSASQWWLAHPGLSRGHGGRSLDVGDGNAMSICVIFLWYKVKLRTFGNGIKMFRNMSFCSTCETRLDSADVNEANGDGSWERIYDGLVLSFLQIHPKVTLRDFQLFSQRSGKFDRSQPQKTSCHPRYESTVQTHFHCHRPPCISDVGAQGFTPWRNERLEPPKTGGFGRRFSFSIRWFSLVPAVDFDRFWGFLRYHHWPSFFPAMAGWIKVQLPSLCWKPRGLKAKTTIFLGDGETGFRKNAGPKLWPKKLL